MKKFISVAIALCASSLACLFLAVVPGCSSTGAPKVQPVVVQIAVNHAVLRYVDGAGDAVDREARRRDLHAALTATLGYLDGDVIASVSAVVDVFAAQIEWDQLSMPDQVLTVSIIELVKFELDKRVSGGELPADTVLYLRDVVQSAISAVGYL